MTMNKRQLKESAELITNLAYYFDEIPKHLELIDYYISRKNNDIL